MKSIIAKNLLQSVLAIVLALILIGLSESVVGLNVARTLLGPKPSYEEVAVLNKQLGLDQPFMKRMLERVLGALRGDFGESYVFHEPVAPLLESAVESSLRLVLPALAVGTVLGTMLGIWVAYHPSRTNRSILALATSIALLPSLVLATLVVYGLGYELGLISPSYIWAVVLLTMVPLFVTSLTAYQEYTTILKSDYIRSARSLGFPEWRVASRYGLKVAMISLTTNFTNIALYLLTATVFVEITFSLPGIGMLLLTATERLDYPILSGASFVIVVFFGIMNVLTGVAVYALDPRTR